MAESSTNTAAEALESQLSAIRAYAARVTDVRVENASSSRITVDVSAHPLASGYTVAGQYLAAGVNANDIRYFAIASPLSSTDSIELLVAPNHEVSAALCALRADDTIWLSDALGGGFGLESAGFDDLVIFVTGTGMAAVRPIIADFAFSRPSRSLTVYYSEKPGVSHAFRDEFDRWRARGVRLELTGGEQAESRFVQEIWADDAARPEPAKAHYIVVGAPAMQQSVLAALSHAGVPSGHVHFNY